MYQLRNQIAIFLRFLWVKDISSDKIKIIVRCFDRVAFGTTASQFLLAVSIHKHNRL